MWPASAKILKIITKFASLEKCARARVVKIVKNGEYMPVIEYRDVDIQIDSKIILENVTLTLDKGEFAYVVGTVGSGKSTLLKTIYGEVDIDGGEIRIFAMLGLFDDEN